ncbi:RlpA-like double-psi beta-barrel domain-containing protein [Sporobolomyces koalae]|uniref:RlpA-like double-psi beta-barrel domain-containing protein n=1 Tax=Sporobolomyces koalae TaxID=500713 RepID=UPI003178073B
MKIAFSTLLALFVATTSVSAACNNRRRSIVPATGDALERREVDAPASLKYVTRRNKSGRRLAGRGPPATGKAPGPLGTRVISDSGSGSDDSSSISSSMTSAAPTRATGSTGKGRGRYAGSESLSQTAAAATSSSTGSSTSTSSSSSGTYSGEATFFYQDGAAGACGSVNSDSSKIVALQTAMYGSGGYCGKTIKITNTATGASTEATVADECPGCSSSSSIDLSTGAFNAIGSEDTGVLNVSWSFE